MPKGKFTQFMISAWREQASWLVLLRPLSILQSLIYRLRRFWLMRIRTPATNHCQVIIVGNISLGGSGKTSMVAAIANRLKQQYLVAIISKGYGRKSTLPNPTVVTASRPQFFGDEPCMLANNLNCPVVVCDDRLKAIECWADKVDVIICDDGLHDYRFIHDFEICLIDGSVGYGNGRLFPEGFLREPIERMLQCDLRLQLGGTHRQYLVDDIFNYTITSCRQINSPIRMSVNKCISAWRDKTIHVYAGLANNHRFFDDLRRIGFDFQEHSYPDHYFYNEEDFTERGIFLMTEKDAIKCADFAKDSFWYVEIAIDVSAQTNHILTTIPTSKHGN